jgi:hypothetical protein
VTRQGNVDGVGAGYIDVNYLHKYQPLTRLSSQAAAQLASRAKGKS